MSEKVYVYNVLYNGKVIDQIRLKSFGKDDGDFFRDEAYSEALNNLEVKLDE